MARAPSFTSSSRKARRHNPLSDDIVSTGPLSAKSKRIPKPENEDKYVDSRASRKILKIGQDLIDEEEEEKTATGPNPAFAFDSRLVVEQEIYEDNQREDEEAWGDEDEEVEEMVYLKISCHMIKIAKSAYGFLGNRPERLEPV